MIHSNSSLNILIIEDNPGDFELVQDYLGEYGLPSIVHAENFKEASAKKNIKIRKEFGIQISPKL